MSYNKSSITDMKTLDVSAVQGPLVISVKAVTVSGKSAMSSVEINKKSAQISNSLPNILANQTSVRLENGLYKVSLFFTDSDGSVLK